MRPRLPAGEFDRLYAADPDPWGFATSPYERGEVRRDDRARSDGRRYRPRARAGLLDRRPHRAAAPRTATTLLAVDVAEAALAQARARLAALPHVRVERREIPEEFPAGPFDLIVASEVLYYLDARRSRRRSRRSPPRSSPAAACSPSTGARRRAPIRCGGDEVHARLAALGWPAGATARTPRYALDRFDRRHDGPAARDRRRRPGRARGGARLPRRGRRRRRDDAHRRRPTRRTCGRRCPRSSCAARPSEPSCARDGRLVRGARRRACGSARGDGARPRRARRDRRRRAGCRSTLRARHRRASPRALPVPGGDDPRVLQPALARRRARACASAPSAARGAIVIGSGFIGCEAAASLAMRGLRVTLVAEEHVAARAAAGRGGRAADRRLARRSSAWRCVLGARGRGDRGRHACASPAAARSRPTSCWSPAASARAPTSPRRPACDAEDGRDRGRRAHAHQRTRDLRGGRRRARPQRRRGPPPAPSSTGARRSTRARSRARTPPASDAAWAHAPGFWSTIGDAHAQARRVGRRLRQARLEDHAGGAFTVWYGARRACTVGVLDPRARRGLRARARSWWSSGRRDAVTLPPPAPGLRRASSSPRATRRRSSARCMRALAAQRGVEPRRRRAACSCSIAARDATATRARAAAPAAASTCTCCARRADGVGAARRLGMDLACERLLAAGRPHGLIASHRRRLARPRPDWLRDAARRRRGRRRARSAAASSSAAAERAALPPAVLERRDAEARARLARARAQAPAGAPRRALAVLGRLDGAHRGDATRRSGRWSRATALEDEGLERLLAPPRRRRSTGSAPCA